MENDTTESFDTGEKIFGLFREYERHALKAYECLRADDRAGYDRLIEVATRSLAESERRLDPDERAILKRCADRTVDVLGKCTALGLRNLEKRLYEFRISECLAALVGTRPAQSSLRHRASAMLQ